MYDPARHVVLCGDPWDAAAASEAIQEIVDDAVGCFDPARFWPTHPKDQGFQPGSTVIYAGAAGVMWTIDYLRRLQATSCHVDFAPSFGFLMEAHQVET